MLYGIYGSYMTVYTLIYKPSFTLIYYDMLCLKLAYIYRGYMYYVFCMLFMWLIWGCGKPGCNATTVTAGLRI